MTSEDQLQLTTQNVEFLEKRDKEIREVLKSIEDVNEIFRDVAALISNQVCRNSIFINEKYSSSLGHNSRSN